MNILLVTCPSDKLLTPTLCISLNVLYVDRDALRALPHVNFPNLRRISKCTNVLSIFILSTPCCQLSWPSTRVNWLRHPHILSIESTWWISRMASKLMPQRIRTHVTNGLCVHNRNVMNLVFCHFNGTILAGLRDMYKLVNWSDHPTNSQVRSCYKNLAAVTSVKWICHRIRSLTHNQTYDWCCESTIRLLNESLLLI